MKIIFYIIIAIYVIAFFVRLNRKLNGNSIGSYGSFWVSISAMIMSVFAFMLATIQDSRIIGVVLCTIGFLVAVIALYSYVFVKPDDNSYEDNRNITVSFSSESVQGIEDLDKSSQSTVKETYSASTNISKEQFNEIKKYCIVLRTLFSRISRDNIVYEAVNEASTSIGGDAMPSNEYFRFVVKSIFIQDMHRCYDEMGHSFVFSPLSTEGQCLILILGLISEETSFASYDTFVKAMSGQSRNDLERAKAYFGKFKNSGVKFSVEGEDEFGLSAMLQTSGGDEDDLQKYRINLYRLNSVIAKIDGTVTPKEQDWLERMMIINGQRPERAKRDLMPSLPEDELKNLIGLQTVKEEVQALSNFISVKRKRKEMGLSLPDVSYHCVFSGNPGTGKTTVARILAGIYRELGVLKKGHLVETDRSGLVAEYVGQTAVKTNKIIDEALDGVLFIDEAYSLVQGGKEDYGKEAIATLLKRMEDDRDRLVVILAGYTNEIEEFINSNPGLRSRFNRYIHFADYTAVELYDIFCLMMKKNEYIMSDETSELLKKHLTEVVNNKPKDFGNARFVRNLFERAVQNQANRLAKEGNLTREMLKEIKSVDWDG